MTKFLAASRKLIDVAVSVHIAGLKAAVRAADRRVDAAMRRTDVAGTVVHDTKALLKSAQDNHSEAGKLERAAIKDRDVTRIAAQAEATKLRRGVVLV